MMEFLPARSFLFATEAFVFGLLAFLLFIYFRGFGREYVRYWLISLSALSVSYGAKAILALQTSTSEHVLYVITQQVSSYIHLLFLMIGIYSARMHKKISIPLIYSLSISALLLGTLAASLYSFDHKSVFNQFYLRTSLQSFIFGCGLLTVSFYLSLIRKHFFASKVLMIFSIFFGLRFILHSFISIIALTEPWYIQFESFLVYLDIGYYSILGFIMLIWMQGAERHTANTAISRVQYLGKHDSLTGALNREQVMAKLPNIMHQAKSNQTKLAIFLIDIKHFKFINDTYGLKTGDFILGEVATRLNNSVLMPQVVGRLSGDSFMYVFEFENVSQVDGAVTHIHKLINRPYHYSGQEIHIQASLGYCFYPDNGIAPEELLQHANLALHHAESNQLASCAFVSGMEAQGRRLILVEKSIREGLANDEFILYFQPQLNLLTNKLEGVEALVRWQHPDRGLLPPSEFLPDIEALAMHSEFDNYILKKACQANARWYQEYKRRIAIAVNITAVEFQDPMLISNIQDLLLEYRISPKYLELEITENVVMTDIDKAMDTIVVLQNMGIKVSIDDFGTGYSSLAYLRRLPIDKIKIDRSFIIEVASNDSDLTIVKSMIELSHGLGKRVLAEGVETKEQLEVLRHLRCDAIQGYFISKPLPEETFVNYLSKKQSNK